jgi:hypothetical protein
MTNDQDPAFDLHEILLGEQKELQAKLSTGRQAAGHPLAIGDGAEDGWRNWIQEFLPSRYRVSKGFVVDSDNTRSEQQDVIIHDRQYSPLLWEYGGHTYVPAESVYAIFEVKQSLNAENVEYAGNKVASVRRRFRTQGTFGWLQGKGTRELIPILSGLLTLTSDWRPPMGAPFSTALGALDLDSHLDLGCVLSDGAWEVPDSAEPSEYEVFNPETSLSYFKLKLLQRLQALGTVGGIDYMAYQNTGQLDSKK